MWQGGAYRKLAPGADGKSRWEPVPPGQAVDHTHVDGSPKRGTPEAAARKVDPVVNKPGKGGKKYAEREAAGQGSLFGAPAPAPASESHSPPPGDKKLADLIEQQQQAERATSKPDLPKVEPAGDQGKVAQEISRQQEGDRVGKMPAKVSPETEASLAGMAQHTAVLDDLNARVEQMVQERGPIPKKTTGKLSSLRGDAKSNGETPTVRGFDATHKLTFRELGALRYDLQAEGFTQAAKRSTGGLEVWTRGRVGEGEHEHTLEQVSLHPGDSRGAWGPTATYNRTERKPGWQEHVKKPSTLRTGGANEPGAILSADPAERKTQLEDRFAAKRAAEDGDPAEVVSMRERAQSLTGNRRQQAEELISTYRKNLTYIATQQQNLKDVGDRIKSTARYGNGGGLSYEKQNRRRHLEQMERYQKHNENIKGELDRLHEEAKRVKAAEEIPDLVARLDKFLYPSSASRGLGQGARGDLPANVHKQLMSWYQDASSFDSAGAKRQSELVDEVAQVKAHMQAHAAVKPGKPDRADLWGKTARKLLDASNGATQDDLHYRAYHRAVLGGQEDQAAHLARTYEGARKARQDLIDAAGTSKSLIVVGESHSPRHLLVKSSSIQQTGVGPPLILMPSEKDPSVRRWVRPNPGESREQFVARYREKRNMEKRHHLAISQQLAGQTDLVSGRMVTADQIGASKKRLAEIKDEEAREAEREQRQTARRDAARAGVQHDLFRPAPMKQGEMPFDAPPPSDKPAPPVKPAVPDKGQGDLFGANAYRARQGQGSLGLF
jgi:hypothetical protein